MQEVPTQVAQAVLAEDGSDTLPIRLAGDEEILRAFWLAIGIGRECIPIVEHESRNGKVAVDGVWKEGYLFMPLPTLALPKCVCNAVVADREIATNVRQVVGAG